MDIKEKLYIYYIKGNDERPEEVIKTLEEKGGNNTDNLTGRGNDLFYYIGNSDVIMCCDKNSKDLYYLDKVYGKELYLPEKHKVMKWEDIKSVWGYFIDGGHWSKTDPQLMCYDCWATEQQTKSVRAAAMISQIREQGKDVYGEIVTYGELAYVIYDSIDDGLQVSVQKFALSGGLLRFNDGYQANLFLENNKELIKEYLKTF